jgi:predicted N-acetyltransferase YhbS
MMVAVEDDLPVAVGSHQPVDVDGTEVSEIVGVATLPRLRTRGLGAGLASALTAHARETADLVFLTAGDDDVARVYERVGFARLATTFVAEPPDADAGVRTSLPPTTRKLAAGPCREAATPTTVRKWLPMCRGPGCGRTG